MFMTTQIIHFTQWARDNPQRKYNSLLGMLFDPDGLNESFERQAANKAPGVDGMRNLYPSPEWMTQAGSRMV